LSQISPSRKRSWDFEGDRFVGVEVRRDRDVTVVDWFRRHSPVVDDVKGSGPLGLVGRLKGVKD
jgi:hypothetical protein